jgi:CAAX amino terminal protease family.
VEEFIPLLRSLVAVGLTLLLAMLRLNAEEFGTAEYYETTRDGERPLVSHRLAWYGLGVAGAIGLLYIHPSPQGDLHLGSGDRVEAVILGLMYGLIGVWQAVGFAWVRYQRIRLPDPSSYPGALLNSTATALIDEVTFRGALLGLLLVGGFEPVTAIVIQTLVYALTTRLGAPKRDRYLLVLALGIGLVGGWLTILTGGIAAAFLGHAITRFAVFVCTGHIGQTKPRGREVEEIEKRHRPPDGWRVIGGRDSATRER